MVALIKDLIVSLLVFARKKPYIIKLMIFKITNFLLYIMRFFNKKYPCLQDAYILMVGMQNFFRMPLFLEGCYVKSIVRRKIEEAMQHLLNVNKMCVNNSENIYKYLGDIFGVIKNNEAFIAFKDGKRVVRSQVLVYGVTDKICSDDFMWFAINTVIITIRDILENYVKKQILEDGLQVYKYYIYLTKYFNDMFLLETNQGFLCLINTLPLDSIYPSIKRKLMEEDIAKIFALVQGKSTHVVLIRRDIAEVLDAALDVVKKSEMKCLDKFYYVA